VNVEAVSPFVIKQMSWKKLFRCLICRSNNTTRRRKGQHHCNSTNAAKLVDDMDQEVDMFSFQISVEDGNNNAVEDTMSLMSLSSSSRIIRNPKATSNSIVGTAALPQVELSLVTTNPILPPTQSTTNSMSTRIPSTTSATTSSQYDDDASSCNRQGNDTVSVPVVLRNVTTSTDSSPIDEQPVVVPIPDDDSMPMDELNHWKQANTATTATATIQNSPRPPLSTRITHCKVPPPPRVPPPPPKVPPPPPMNDDLKHTTKDTSSSLPNQRLKRMLLSQEEEEENTHPNIPTHQHQQQPLATIPPWYSMSVNPDRISSSSTANNNSTTTTIRRSSSKKRSSTTSSAASVQSQGSDPFSDLSSHPDDEESSLASRNNQRARKHIVSDDESNKSNLKNSSSVVSRLRISFESNVLY